MYYNYYTPRHTSGFVLLFFGVLAAVALLAGAVIVLEASKIQHVRTTVAGVNAATFGWMLVSLSGVVLSAILPDRVGKAVLFIGSVGFFACLAVALAFGIRI